MPYLQTIKTANTEEKEIWGWTLAGRHSAHCEAHGTVFCSSGRTSCEKDARVTVVEVGWGLWF